MNVSENATDTIEILFVPPSAVAVRGNNLGGGFGGDFLYTYAYLLTIAADCDIQIKERGADFYMEMPLSLSPISSTRNMVSVSITTLSLLLTPDLVDLQLGGSVIAEVANALIDMFKDMTI